MVSNLTSSLHWLNANFIGKHIGWCIWEVTIIDISAYLTLMDSSDFARNQIAVEQAFVDLPAVYKTELSNRFYTTYLSENISSDLRGNIEFCAPILWGALTKEDKKQIGKRFDKDVVENDAKKIQRGLTYIQFVNGMMYVKPSTWFQTGLASTLGFLMPIVGPLLSLVIAASLLLLFAFRSALNPSKIKGGLDAIVNSDKALLMKTSRSESVYQHDLSTNALEYQAYCDAVKATWEDGTPFIPFLIGTNTVVSRGFKNSWTTGQVTGLTLNQLRQHLMVLGGTGSGIRPLFP